MEDARNRKIKYIAVIKYERRKGFSIQQHRVNYEERHKKKGRQRMELINDN